MEHSSVSSTPMRILLVEDDEDMRILCRKVLESPEFQIHECCNGGEAVNLYPYIRPDLVLMDIIMPVMDGIEATMHIRRSDPNAHVVLFSDFGDSTAREASRHAGASAYWLKEDIRCLPAFINSLELVPRTCSAERVLS